MRFRCGPSRAIGEGRKSVTAEICWLKARAPRREVPAHAMAEVQECPKPKAALPSPPLTPVPSADPRSLASMSVSTNPTGISDKGTPGCPRAARQCMSCSTTPLRPRSEPAPTNSMRPTRPTSSRARPATRRRAPPLHPQSAWPASSSKRPRKTQPPLPSANAPADAALHRALTVVLFTIPKPGSLLGENPGSRFHGH